MSSETSRLGLDEPAATDTLSGFPAEDVQALSVLDGAVIITEGTLASRPASTQYGNEYYATDTGSVSKYLTAWQTVLCAGPWQSLSAGLASGVVQASSSYFVSCRLEGDIVRLKGTMENETGSTTAANFVWLTLPTGYRPSAPAFVTLASPSGNASVPFTIATNGQMSSVQQFTNFSTVAMDGVTFTLS